MVFLQAADLERFKEKLGEDVISEPLFPRQPMAVSPTRLQGSSPTPAGAQLGTGARIGVKYCGGADPIEDGSEVQQGHFRPPSHGAVRGRYRSYSSQPASS